MLSFTCQTIIRLCNTCSQWVVQVVGSWVEFYTSRWYLSFGCVEVWFLNTVFERSLTSLSPLQKPINSSVNGCFSTLYTGLIKRTTKYIN